MPQRTLITGVTGQGGYYLARLMLERVGASVVTATDGVTAGELFRGRAADIDLVILDINMPGMDGAATCEEIRSIRPDVPVLFCSGRGHAEGAARIADQGAAGFLQKPFTFDTLREKIAEVLDAVSDAVSDEVSD